MVRPDCIHAGRVRVASCITITQQAVTASSAVHGDEVMAWAPEDCDQAEVMSLLDPPAVQTR